METKTKKLHFTIEGEFMTNLVRSMWVEGRILPLIEILKSTNCPERYWIPICIGEADMVGNSTDGLNIETEPKEKQTHQHQITLDLDKSIERFEKQYIKYSIEYLNAEARLKYWPFVMSWDGRTYARSGGRGGSKTMFHSAKRDEQILKRRAVDIKEVGAMFDYVYPYAKKTFEHFPKEKITEGIEYLDKSDPNFLPNLHEKARSQTLKENHDEMVLKPIREIVAEREKKAKQVLKSTRLKPKDREETLIDYRILDNPWEDKEINFEEDISSLELPEIDSQYGAGITFISEDVVYKTEQKGPRKVTLDITTYRGQSIGALHYYGKLRIEGPQIPGTRLSSSGWSDLLGAFYVELKHPLEEWEVKKWPNRFQYREIGNPVPGFYTKGAIKKYAKELMEKKFKGDWRLVVEEDED